MTQEEDWIASLPIGDKSKVVKNPYTGESHELNPTELAVFQNVMFNQAMVDLYGGPLSPLTAEFQTEMAVGIAWFRANNVEAYFKLLD